MAFLTAASRKSAIVICVCVCTYGTGFETRRRNAAQARQAKPSVRARAVGCDVVFALCHMRHLTYYDLVSLATAATTVAARVVGALASCHECVRSGRGNPRRCARRHTYERRGRTQPP